MNKVIASPEAPKAVGPYSQAILADKTLYISGQLPVDGATGTVAETIEDQTRQSLKNLKAILNEAGMGFEDVVKVTGFHKQSPMVQFQYRRNQIANISGEKINQQELEDSVDIDNE